MGISFLKGISFQLKIVHVSKYRIKVCSLITHIFYLYDFYITRDMLDLSKNIVAVYVIRGYKMVRI